MATKLNAGEVSRQDIFLIYPEHIKVDYSKRGRRILPSQVDVVALAESIQDKGQQQPCKVRALADKTVELVFGFTRYDAICYYNDHIRSESQERLKVKCTLVTCNDEEALILNIVENKMRNATNALDDAHNMRRLQELYSYDDAKLASIYKCTVAWVSQIRKLLTLPSSIQEQIGTGITVSAALHLCDLPAEQQVAVVNQAASAGTTVKIEEVKKAKRKTVGATGDASRSLKEVKDFFEGLTGPAELPAIKSFAKSSLDFIKGKISEKAYENAIHRLRENK